MDLRMVQDFFKLDIQNNKDSDVKIVVDENVERKYREFSATYALSPMIDIIDEIKMYANFLTKSNFD